MAATTRWLGSAPSFSMAEDSTLECNNRVIKFLVQDNL